MDNLANEEAPLIELTPPISSERIVIKIADKFPPNSFIKDKDSIGVTPSHFIRQTLNLAKSVSNKQHNLEKVLCKIVVFLGLASDKLGELSVQGSISRFDLVELSDEIDVIVSMTLEALRDPNIVPKPVNSSFNKSEYLSPKACDSPKTPYSENTNESSFNDSGNTDSINHNE